MNGTVASQGSGVVFVSGNIRTRRGPRADAKRMSINDIGRAIFGRYKFSSAGGF